MLLYLFIQILGIASVKTGRLININRSYFIVESLVGVNLYPPIVLWMIHNNLTFSVTYGRLVARERLNHVLTLRSLLVKPFSRYPMRHSWWSYTHTTFVLAYLMTFPFWCLSTTAFVLRTLLKCIYRTHFERYNCFVYTWDTFIIHCWFKKFIF